MKLADYCPAEFYQHHRLTYSPSPCPEDTSEIRQSSGCYEGFCNEWLALPKEREQGIAQVLYAIIPAAFYASSGQEIDPPVTKDVVEFMETWPTSNAPFSMHHIALDVRQRQLFRQVPVRGLSLDLGAGDGNASNYIFSPNRLTVGSDPLLYSTLRAKVHNRYEQQACFDMTNVAFADESFDTIFIVHSIDHIKDRLDALREVARLIRPGGTVALTDSTSYIKELMPLAHVWREIGMPEQAADAYNRLLDVCGERTEFYLGDYYELDLADLGFENIRFEYFTSPQLTRQVCLYVELQFALGYYESIIRNDVQLREFYFEQAKRAIIPLLSSDWELCANGKAMNIFVTAKKQGVSRTVAEPISSRYICPACRTPLSTFTCGSYVREYPVVEGIPLLIPFYADAWRQIKDYLPAPAKPTLMDILKKAASKVPGLLPLLEACGDRQSHTINKTRCTCGWYRQNVAVLLLAPMIHVRGSHERFSQVSN